MSFVTLVGFQDYEVGAVWINPEHVCAVSGTEDKLGRYTNIHMIDGVIWTVKGSLTAIADAVTR